MMLAVRDLAPEWISVNVVLLGSNECYIWSPEERDCGMIRKEEENREEDNCGTDEGALH